MFVASNNKNTLNEILLAYLKNNEPRINAVAPERTNSRDIGFQLARSTFEMGAPTEAADRDQTRNGSVCFAILK